MSDSLWCMDCSPPGSSVLGIFQARILDTGKDTGVGSHSLLHLLYCRQILYHLSCHSLSCSVVSDSAIPWTAACQASLVITNSQNLLKLRSTELAMPCNNLIICFPLLLPPSILPSITVFYNESALCIRWSKYWSFNFNISPSNEYSGLISSSIDWLDLLAVSGTLKNHQHHSSNAYTHTLIIYI